MKKTQFIQILRKYRKGTVTPEERRFVETYYDLFGLSDGELTEKEAGRLKQEMLQKIWEEIRNEEEGNAPKMQNFFMRPMKVAAAILVLLVSGIILYTIVHRQANTRERSGTMAVRNPKDDILPGGNKAVLTLANGNKVVLDSMQDGSLAQQGNTQVLKLGNGKLLYDQHQAGAASEKEPLQMVYNTLTTPKGGQYQIVLADGSKVWLNAASSLRFPASFTGDTRTVEVTGEAYFEIARQVDKPFIVKAGDTHVEVLGTHFNVKDYDNDKTIRTTLSEGAVKISLADGHKEAVRLSPGMQASFSKQTGRMEVSMVNVEAVLAWKNGLFYFEKTNIKTIMDEVSRWYNVDVVYKINDLENKNFSGVLSRYGNVTALLERLEFTGTIHFEIIGRTIIVTS